MIVIVGNGRSRPKWAEGGDHNCAVLRSRGKSWWNAELLNEPRRKKAEACTRKTGLVVVGRGPPSTHAAPLREGRSHSQGGFKLFSRWAPNSQQNNFYNPALMDPFLSGPVFAVWCRTRCPGAVRFTRGCGFQTKMNSHLAGALLKFTPFTMLLCWLHLPTGSQQQTDVAAGSATLSFSPKLHAERPPKLRACSPEKVRGTDLTVHPQKAPYSNI